MRAQIFIIATFVAFVASDEYIVSGDFPIEVENIPQMEPIEDRKILDETKVRIIGGKQARPAQFPYQAGLLINIVPGISQSWCGGSLISTRHVLTAAHCVFMPQYYKLANGSITMNSNYYDIVSSIDVYLGLTNKYDRNERQKQIIRVTKSNIIRHEYYDRTRIYNDVSILNLPITVKLSQHIQLINLPRRNQGRNDLYGRKIVSSGWGIFNGKQVSPVLRYAEMQVISFSECRSHFRSTLVDDYHICINAPGRSACNGDSGGPNVITEKDGSKTVVGVTSFVSGYGCEAGYPTVLTRISTYLNWIQQKTGIPIRN